MAWTSTTTDGGQHVHVLPDDDAITHTEDDSCVCGPRIEPVERPDGTVGWLIVHHSLDGREDREVNQ